MGCGETYRAATAHATRSFPLEVFQRQKQAALFAGKSATVILFIERLHTIVLGIDDDRIDRRRRARPDNTADGVDQQDFAKPTPLCCSRSTAARRPRIAAGTR